MPPCASRHVLCSRADRLHARQGCRQHFGHRRVALGVAGGGVARVRVLVVDVAGGVVVEGVGGHWKVDRRLE